ncbi:hypothetical protein F2Q70_00010220 [Brassica cretica]|uniref:Uncharacterized protein n=1 Tax=Brassica cretica TaxID=69181 RepID=A0A8S9M582_BRACR|nr:hypothetical protein F2Q70_00010220 [Brassica cretica]
MMVTKEASARQPTTYMSSFRTSVADSMSCLELPGLIGELAELIGELANVNAACPQARLRMLMLLVLKHV